MEFFNEVGGAAETRALSTSRAFPQFVFACVCVVTSEVFLVFFFFHVDVVCLRGKCAVLDLSFKKKQKQKKRVKTKLATRVKASAGKQVRG